MWPVKNSSALVENLFFQKNPLQGLLSSLNAVISTNESTRFITDHMIYNLAYTSILQTTTTKLKSKRSTATSLFFPLDPTKDSSAMGNTQKQTDTEKIYAVFSGVFSTLKLVYHISIILITTRFEKKILSRFFKIRTKP